MKKRIIPVLAVIVLILAAGGILAGRALYERYSYGTERMDLEEYFGVSGDELAIVLQDEVIDEKALLQNGICYFDEGTVETYLNDGFYVSRDEQIMIYTTASEIISVPVGSGTVTVKSGVNDEGVIEELSYIPVFEQGGIYYLAADYVKRFTNFSADVYDHHVQVYTEWGTKEVDYIKRKTSVRYRGGIKSEILRDMDAGEEVEILERMEDWSKIKTSDSIIGYVENKRLEYASSDATVTLEETPVTDYVPEEYNGVSMDGKVSLAWHSIGGIAGNDTLEDMLAESDGINVIAPTWFSVCDESGNIRSYGTSEYVAYAHGKGLKVWGVLDDFNYSAESGNSVSISAVLSGSESRARLITNIINTSKELSLDGINLDFERITEESGPDFVQFIKELSIECRRSGLVLSIDDYVPYNFRDYYRLDVQAQVADYVVIMGYDEHWHGSGEAGSVASIDYVTDGIDMALREVPAEKLINALPFYTLVWETEGDTVTDEYLSISRTAEFIEKNNLSPQWDEDTCQNYSEWTSEGIFYQVWFEDAQSIAAKLNVMTSRDLAGVAVWRLGYGSQSVWALINAYAAQ